MDYIVVERSTDGEVVIAEIINGAVVSDDAGTKAMVESLLEQGGYPAREPDAERAVHGTYIWVAKKNEGNTDTVKPVDPMPMAETISTEDALVRNNKCPRGH